MKYTKLIAITAAAALMCAALSACGNSSEPAGIAQTDSASNPITEVYLAYIQTFSEEFDSFVNGDLDTILNGVATLTADNFDEWKSTYDNYYERCQYWNGEFGAAETMCPEDMKELHNDISVAIGNIYAELQGMEEKVDAAVKGDLSQLKAFAEEYSEAYETTSDLWKSVSERI